MFVGYGESFCSRSSRQQGQANGKLSGKETWKTLRSVVPGHAGETLVVESPAFD